LYVVSINTSLGYVGLTAYGIQEDDEVGEVFLQNDDEIQDMLGRQGLDLCPVTIARRLAEYAMQ
jgi:hypothetical protein